MPKNKVISAIFLLAAALLIVAGCTYPRPEADLGWDYTPEQRDSIAFAHTHHYSENFNFAVLTDSMLLLPQSPADIMQSLSDTAVVVRGDRVVVADVARCPADTADTIWIKLARDQATLGWIPEQKMLRGVVPDDPISRFIHVFGNRRNVALSCAIVIAVALLLLRAIRRRSTRIVHFNDVDSTYPTLLCIDVALLAAIYASIQHFVPQTWQEFYFHPSLNPFAVPPALAAMLVCFWAVIVLAIASVDDVTRKCGPAEASSYLLSLAGMTLVVYLVAAVTTKFYFGYALVVGYAVFAIVRRRSARTYRYVCGRCGHKLRHKGTCPFCGANNV